MRDLNNNFEIGKVQNTNLKQDRSDKVEPQQITEIEDASVKDFSNPSAEALGRSQVSKTDNLREDVSFAYSNPKAIESSDKLFDMALKNLLAENDPEAYEKACAIATSPDARDLLSK